MPGAELLRAIFLQCGVHLELSEQTRVCASTARHSPLGASGQSPPEARGQSPESIKGPGLECASYDKTTTTESLLLRVYQKGHGKTKPEDKLILVQKKRLKYSHTRRL